MFLLSNEKWNKIEIKNPWRGQALLLTILIAMMLSIIQDEFFVCFIMNFIPHNLILQNTMPKQVGGSNSNLLEQWSFIIITLPLTNACWWEFSWFHCPFFELLFLVRDERTLGAVRWLPFEFKLKFRGIYSIDFAVITIIELGTSFKSLWDRSELN